MKRFLFLIMLTGCGDSGELAAMRAAFENAKETVVSEQKATSEKTTEAVVILKENTAALARIETKLEASLSSPKSNGTEVIKSAPNPPAKANTQQTPLKVATPGDFSQETLVELATRLYAQGVNTHMKTREELEAIDAQMKAGQPVTGAIFQNQRTSAVTSQRSAVRLVPRGKGVVRWQRNSAGQTCGPNGCY
jgi:hypothetical protein